MRVTQDASMLSTITNSADLYNGQANSNSTTQTTKTSQTQNNVDVNNVDSSNGATLEKQRETYGLSTIENMSDDEYAAFERATANMSPTEKMRAAQSLHLVAKSYQQAQSNANGGGLVDYMNGKTDFFATNQNVLEQGIQVLKQMSGSDSKMMSNFLGTFKSALSSSGINLTA